MTPKEPPSLADVPAELRLNIYGHLFESCTLKECRGIYMSNHKIKAEMEDELPKWISKRLDSLAKDHPDFHDSHESISSTISFKKPANFQECRNMRVHLKYDIQPPILDFDIYMSYSIQAQAWSMETLDQKKWDKMMRALNTTTLLKAKALSDILNLPVNTVTFNIEDNSHPRARLLRLKSVERFAIAMTTLIGGKSKWGGGDMSLASGEERRVLANHVRVIPIPSIQTGSHTKNDFVLDVEGWTNGMDLTSGRTFWSRDTAI